MRGALIVLLAFLNAPAAQGATLRVAPEDFSPKATTLSIDAVVGRPRRLGIRLATASGTELGWLSPPAVRSRVHVTWRGRLHRKELPEGDYEVRLVAAGQTVAKAPFRLDATAPRLEELRVGNGGNPFGGDRRLLATITPTGDGLRERAVVRFRLIEPGTVTLEVQRSKRDTFALHAETRDLPAGTHELVWAPPPRTAPRTYVLSLTARDEAGNVRAYGPTDAYNVGRSFRAPVVRVLGIDAAFARPGYAPGQTGLLRVSTDAPKLTYQVFRVGGEEKPSYLQNEMSGVPVMEPVTLSWLHRGDAPVELPVGIGPWPTGVYYVELKAHDGRIGYAPFVVRPPFFGARTRVAVVLPTTTWQAYNHYDANGDGWGDTWYAGRSDWPVALGRPFLYRGVPDNFHRYETPFLNWLARTEKAADFLSEDDLALFRNGRELAGRYHLVVFPGHTEYVTKREYDLIEQYRNASGNLVFLSANNFFWRISQGRRLLRRTALWRDAGRPEARLIGAQYRANDDGRRQGLFVVRNVARAPWLWSGTGLAEGSTFGEAVGGYGVEIDARTKDSPPGTRVLAEIPDLFGPGVTAQMTYYETRKGAKVFAAGTLDFVGSVLFQPVDRMLENLWSRLSRP